MSSGISRGFSTAVSDTYGSKMPYEVRSICPECKRPLTGTIFEKSGKVFIKRKCPKHGLFEEIYWDDSKEFERARKYANKSRGLKSNNVFVTENSGTNCPFDCGLCTNHQNHTALANIALTNRCDLSCWYCFFYAKEGDPIYEPSTKQIRSMLRNLRSIRPVPTNAIQFTGGEPTLRKDIIEIIKIAREEGFEHVQLNTHGINLANNPGMAKKLRDAGVSTLYLSFDGTTPQTNPKNHYEMPRILDECRKAGMGIVLVPTLIKGINDNDVGNILDFALRNIDVIRGIDFQPVSFVGRMPKKLRDKQRVTIPYATKTLEGQTKGAVKEKDFFTIPCVAPVTEFIESITGNEQYALNTHFACGTATYLFVENGKVIPLPEFFDIEGFFRFLRERAEAIKQGKNKGIEAARILLKINSFIDKKKQPKSLGLAKLIFNALVRHDYSTLGSFHTKTLFVGMMHFMDPYNYDQQRVERCQIHYAMPDGRIIPFCAFNVIPELYRDKVQKQFSLTWDEWVSANPGIDISFKYKHDSEKLSSEQIYRRTYYGNKYFGNIVPEPKWEKIVEVEEKKEIKKENVVKVEAKKEKVAKGGTKKVNVVKVKVKKSAKKVKVVKAKTKKPAKKPIKVSHKKKIKASHRKVVKKKKKK